MCSDHFSPESFKTVTKTGKAMERRLLRTDAVPTLFACLPASLQPNSSKRPAPADRSAPAVPVKKLANNAVQTQTDTTGLYVDSLIDDIERLREDLNQSRMVATKFQDKAAALQAAAERLSKVIDGM